MPSLPASSRGPLPRAALLLLLLSGCATAPTIVVSNSAPTVTILSPSTPDGTDPVVDEDEPVALVCQVADDETLPEELVIEWAAQPLDGGAPIDLGTAVADTDGRASLNWTGFAEGSYLLTVSVLDEGGLGSDAQLTLFVEGEDLPPIIAITAPGNGDDFVEGDNIRFSATTSDDRGLDQLSVAWSSSVEGDLFTAAPDALGVVSFDSTSLRPGTHTITATVTDESAQSAQDMIDIEVAIQDLPPSPPMVDVVPDSPTVSDDLTCLITVPSVDPNGGEVSYSYLWELDGMATGFSAATLTAVNTGPDQTWRCVVTPQDDTGLTGETGSDQVTIGNSAPSVDEVELGPDPAYEGSTLSCLPGTGFDPDGDPVSFLYGWLIDGAVVAGAEDETLDGASFDKGDEVSCTVTPSDGFSTGATVESEPVIIQNTPPAAPVVLLDPERPTRLDDINCLLETSPEDPDPADLPSVTWTWLRDGSPTGLTSATLSADETTLGEVWTCEVVIDDGEASTAPVSASADIHAEPGALVVTELMVAPWTVSDAYGEWVEIYNPGSVDISLSGWRLRDDGTDTHELLVSAPIVPAGGRVVLANADDPVVNGGVSADYRYSGLEFDDAGDEIELVFLDDVIDRVAWSSSWPIVDGQALSLSPDFLSATENDLSVSWCAATSPLRSPPQAADFGTPGAANDNCACDASDGDMDGFGDHPSCTVPDCDDSDPGVNPTAPEICEDGIDQDCSGSDLLCDCSATDSDGDGFGTGAACSQIDCDDSNVQVYPGAPEYCDGFDNDCNGTTDPVDSLGCSNWYRDDDGDGYGAPGASCRCSAGGGYIVESPGDCFDDNELAYPGQTGWFAADRGDGSHDYNCDGRSDQRFTDLSGTCAFFSDLCSGESGWSGSSPPSCGGSRTWEYNCRYIFDPFGGRVGCYFDNRTDTQECR